MFSLLRCALCESSLSENERMELSEEELGSLYALSKKQDVAHIVGYALEKEKLLSHESSFFAKFQKQQMIAILRQERLDYELSQIRGVLEAAKIRFLPLKGSVLRSLYPVAWLRTSCDIDVLVDEAQLDSCVALLCEKLGYTTDGERNYHDISMYSSNGVHLELHFSIKENMDSIDKLLSEVWSYAVLIDEKEYQYRLTNEYLIFYCIAHMAHHFVNGGCGIKPFLDLFLIQKNIEFNLETVREFCSICNLQTFYEKVTELMHAWFEDKSKSDLILKMQSYILQGGVYGTLENKVITKQGISGGKFKYAWSRIFLTSKTLMNYYPCIKKHIWLTPFCQIHRWFKIFSNGHRFRQSVNELKSNNSISKENVTEMTRLLKEIGL